MIFNILKLIVAMKTMKIRSHKVLAIRMGGVKRKTIIKIIMEMETFK